MPEFVSSPIFLIAAALFAILLVFGILKYALRFVIWIVIIFAILLCLGIVKQPGVLWWIKNLDKIVG